jgi:phosphoribosyl-AMP cyclohydrolase
MPSYLDDIKWTQDGLVPAIAQDATSGRILMMAWMNPQALQQTAESGKAVYWSRSRGKLWRKGESSGHEQLVQEIQLDCDADVIILKVVQQGGIACHTGRESCFYRTLRDGEWRTEEPVLRDPKEIYS